MKYKKEDINYRSIFAGLPSFLGLKLKMYQGRWIGAYYLSGEKHKKRDKLTIYYKNNNIRLLENGGDTMSLWSWLLEYGGYSSHIEVAEALISESGKHIELPPEREIKKIYVYPKFMRETTNLFTDNLFRFLCKLFPEERVKHAYRLYGVASRGIDTVYWFQDGIGICHDKQMAYNASTGKRDRDKHPTRRYKSDKGFLHRTFFGNHLIKDLDYTPYCCESEKTAILFYLMFGKVCVATGGSMALTKGMDKFKLLPDMDMFSKWEKFGTVIDWASHYPDIKIGEKDDIGDVIVSIQKSKSR